MRTFLNYLLSLISPLIFLISIILIFVVPKNYYSDLEFYQNEKIKLIDNNSTIFFGDSSCGNGLDAEIYGENTYNMSLTGPHTSCGSLSLLKMILKNNKIKKAYFMFSINSYSLSLNPGYKIDNNTNIDYFYIKIRLVKNLLKKIIFGIKEPVLIIDYKNDYIKQRNRQADFSPKDVDISLSNDNKKCVNEISRLCKNYNIDYKFMLGPNINRISKKSLSQFQEYFLKNQIEFIKNYYLISSEEIGDRGNHISSNFKSNSTKFYKDLLK